LLQFMYAASSSGVLRR